MIAMIMTTMMIQYEVICMTANRLIQPTLIPDDLPYDSISSRRLPHPEQKKRRKQKEKSLQASRTALETISDRQGHGALRGDASDRVSPAIRSLNRLDIAILLGLALVWHHHACA